MAQRSKRPGRQPGLPGTVTFTFTTSQRYTGLPEGTLGLARCGHVDLPAGRTRVKLSREQIAQLYNENKEYLPGGAELQL